MTHQIINADCLDALRDLPDNSVHAVVTDPPYGLSNTDPKHVAETITRWANGDREYMPTGKGFMGAAWDAFVPPVAVWDECLRVLKPGGHMLVFAGSRTQDLMGLSIRLAGFDIRDTIMWVYGSGLPHGQNVARLIDRSAGVKQASSYVPHHKNKVYGQGHGGTRVAPEAPLVTDAAKQWAGWSTALKPANEPIIVARKPFRGTGALNIDACRVGTEGGCAGASPGPSNGIYGEGLNGAWAQPVAGLGRYPANVILDEHAAAELDQQAGGDHAKYFYCAKASQKERPYVNGVAHSTVKPLKLMEYLVTLVTPPEGTILDPFAGSGTTIEAAINKEFNAIGIEREADYLPLIQARIDRAKGHNPVTAETRTPA
ncbi:DNA-methyltransferase [Rothia koreensis]|uniref:DNA-methyltransferase n=1 Tax=Rothia koreensis TaxID=592378 RepID=UPI003FCCDA70